MCYCLFGGTGRTKEGEARGSSALARTEGMKGVKRARPRRSAAGFYGVTVRPWPGFHPQSFHSPLNRTGLSSVYLTVCRMSL
jgi:hypothetical protein